jgi:hypothetical protein
MGPLDHAGFPCGLRTKTARVGLDAYPAQIESIGVPAGLDGHVRLQGPVAVPRAGCDQQGQILRPKREHPTVELLRELGGPGTVSGVLELVLAARIMKKGEELDDVRAGSCGGGEPEAIGSDPGPMSRAMDAAPVEREPVSNLVHQLGSDRRVIHGINTNLWSRRDPFELFDGNRTE